MYQMRCTAYKKIAPDDGLIQSETYRSATNKNKSLITRIFVHLVALHIYDS